MEIALTAVFIFLLSLIFALWEIEIEGKNGWAKKLPTWYKKSGVSSAFYNLTKKPLSGYHLMMLLFTLASFHVIFFLNTPWNLFNEINIFIVWLIFLIIEDFLWFQFNPYYGSKKFKRKNVWWYGNEKWIFEIFPISYLRGIYFLICAIVISAMVFNSNSFLKNYLELIGIEIVFSLISQILVKPYQFWYKKMRTLDESKTFNRKIIFEKI